MSGGSSGGSISSSSSSRSAITANINGSSANNSTGTSRTVDTMHVAASTAAWSPSRGGATLLLLLSIGLRANCDALCVGARNGLTVELMSELLRSNPSIIGQRGPYGLTAAEHAALYGCAEQMDWLVARVDCPPIDWRRVLAQACEMLSAPTVADRCLTLAEQCAPSVVSDAAMFAVVQRLHDQLRSRMRPRGNALLRGKRAAPHPGICHM